MQKVRVSIQVNNLPEDVYSYGDWLVVRISGGEFWYYGCYEDKHRADYAAREVGGMAFKLSRG